MFHFRSLSKEKIASLLRLYSKNLYTLPASSKDEVPQLSEPARPQLVEEDSDSTLGPLSGLENRERSDAYSHKVLRISDTWRVIACSEGIQWILQKRKGYLDGRPAWDGKSFCRSKAGLRRAIREKVGSVSQEVEVQLAQLPDWIES
ncbi:MAG: hypothetical protein EOR43_32225 [Mesorhizobium sp.]|uniref:hypothetical protein n=1 Tax=Mesorhizobium sp. TaxID=1871066 RepID=UPI000FE3D194|nr:hypothetical protein [Mesorhizobium sp.]RWK14786.1 MAG: hypothetical protein EOR43_32225 [Mesorhizobium sp.]RWK32619.1 MAG: hypothetical protein EOR44_10430 [Mesorhizobium sp.]